MTGMDERLAKVAEVLAGHAYDPANGWACTCGETFGGDMVFVRPLSLDAGRQFCALHSAHQADVLAPLLAEWQAEDEARGRDQVSPARGSAYDGGYLDGQADGAQRVAEAVEAAIEEHGQAHLAGHKWIRDDHLRAALDGAQS